MLVLYHLLSMALALLMCIALLCKAGATRLGTLRASRTKALAQPMPGNTAYHVHIHT